MRSSLLRYLTATLAIAATVALIHGPWIAGTWSTMTWEDPMWFEYVAREIRTPVDCFTAPPLWPGLYRPLTTGCYYAAGVVLFGQQIEPFHAITVAMYVANGVLLFALARRLLPQAGWLWSLVPTLLWVSRRAHVETVTLAVEFQSLFTVFCSLLAMLIFISGRDGKVGGQQREESLRPRHAPQSASSAGSRAARAGDAITARTIFTALLLILALLSKESAVVLPAILLAHDWAFQRLRTRRDWLPHLAFFSISAMWVVLFFTLFRATSAYEPTGFGYASSLSGTLRVALRNATAHFINFSNLLVTLPSLRENVILSPTVARMVAGRLGAGCGGGDADRSAGGVARAGSPHVDCATCRSHHRLWLRFLPARHCPLPRFRRPPLYALQLLQSRGPRAGDGRGAVLDRTASAAAVCPRPLIFPHFPATIGATCSASL